MYTFAHVPKLDADSFFKRILEAFVHITRRGAWISGLTVVLRAGATAEYICRAIGLMMFVVSDAVAALTLAGTGE